MNPNRFKHFLAIDWSGAKGPRQPGIALALADAAGGAPALVEAPKGGWAREEVLYLLCEELPNNTLIGVDLGISLPFEDAGAFFPGWDESPADAKSLWAQIDEICSYDPHLEASRFVDHPELLRYFRRPGGLEGDRFHINRAADKRGRFRVTEHRQQAMGCKPYSNFNLVGAAQVGKSSLTGMRMIHQLRGFVPVWPIDPLPEAGSVIVEIYTGLAAIAAGRSANRSKIRDHDELNQALAHLGSPAVKGSGPIDDHSSDALITAAWLRNVAEDEGYWQPEGLTDQIAATEGWTFGAI